MLASYARCRIWESPGLWAGLLGRAWRSAFLPVDGTFSPAAGHVAIPRRAPMAANREKW